ncbi:MAG: M50 family metallopeptidase [Oscillospiraceae bacterium]|nr:M50 family metallopeptidase [Oscillospiraceae bacterium]
MNTRLKYFLILVIEVILWNTIVMRPIRLFAVFLHELGHTAMVLLFGGKVQSFQINLDESGYVLSISRGGFASFMIASGGYLGGVLLSILILWLGNKYGGKYVLGVTAIVFITVAVVFSGVSITLLYATFFAVIVLLIFMLKNAGIENAALEIIGVGALMYGIYDTFVDTILFELNKLFHFASAWTGKAIVTDAVHLANITKIPAILWGCIWFLISILVVYKFLTDVKSGGTNKIKSAVGGNVFPSGASRTKSVGVDRTIRRSR